MAKVTSWMRTQSLPRFFLINLVGLYSVVVGLGTTTSELLFNEYWKRPVLAGVAFIALIGAIRETSRERARRRAELSPAAPDPHAAPAPR